MDGGGFSVNCPGNREIEVELGTLAVDCTFLHTEGLPAVARFLYFLILKMKAHAVASRGRRSGKRRGVIDPRGGWGNMDALMVQDYDVLFGSCSLALIGAW